MTSPRRPLRTALLTLLLLAVSIGTWWAWLGWDHEYHVDAATGELAGPYRSWQVVGCVITLVAVALLAHAVLHPVLVGAAMTFGFTTGFAGTALPEDESGLAAVGVVLVFVGMALASAVIGAVVVAVRHTVRRP